MEMVTDNIYIDIDEVNKNIESWGYKCLDSKYISAKTKLSLVDDEGYKYYTTYDSLKGTKGKSRFVSRGNIYTIENIKIWLLKKGLPYVLLSDKFKGSKNKIRLFCQKHNVEFEIEWGNLAQGQHCYLCGKDIITEKNKKRREEHVPKEPKIRKEYKYNVGDIVNGKIILKQIRMSNGSELIGDMYKKTCKGYLVKCTEDGYEWEITEYNLIKRGCPVCSNKVCIKGVNDIATTHPHLVKYFVNIEDAYNNTHSKRKGEFDMICPRCRYVRKRKIEGLSTYGIACTNCGSGVSVPEKFMRNIFKELNVSFKSEKTFQWSQRKRYDFYFKYYNEEYIIEIHGTQHYSEGWAKRGRSLAEEQENDKFKKELAIKNGIKEDNYIVINANKNNLKIMSKSVQESNLSKIFDINSIDLTMCYFNSFVNEVERACEEWNTHKNISKVAKILNLSDGTIREYLKRGQVLGLCNYIPKKNNKLKGNKNEIKDNNTATNIG